MREWILQYGMDVAMVAITAAITAWRTRANVWRSVGTAIADWAVGKTEREYVQPVKAGQQAAKLTTEQQAVARDKAAMDIQQMALQLGLDVAKVAAPGVSDMVERAVRRAKLRLPKASLDRLPVLILAAAVAAYSLTGCATIERAVSWVDTNLSAYIPDDWDQSDPDVWTRVAEAAIDRIYTADSTDPAVKALADAGRLAAREYLLSRAADKTDKYKNERYKAGVLTLQRAVKRAVPELVASQSVADLIRQVTEVRDAGDTDALLGLIVAGIWQQEGGR